MLIAKVASFIPFVSGTPGMTERLGTSHAHPRYQLPCLQNTLLGSREMARQLRAGMALAEDLSLVPQYLHWITHNQPPVSPTARDPTPSSGLCGQTCERAHTLLNFFPSQEIKAVHTRQPFLEIAELG